MSQSVRFPRHDRSEIRQHFVRSWKTKYEPNFAEGIVHLIEFLGIMCL